LYNVCSYMHRWLSNLQRMIDERCITMTADRLFRSVYAFSSRRFVRRIYAFSLHRRFIADFAALRCICFKTNPQSIDPYRRGFEIVAACKTIPQSFISCKTLTLGCLSASSHFNQFAARKPPPQGTFSNPFRGQ
jgi:hypothetical protein